MERARPLIDSAAKDQLPNLRHIVIMNAGNRKLANGPSTTATTPADNADHPLNIYDWQYLLKLGDQHLKPVTPPTPHNIYLICHTSGTTGKYVITSSFDYCCPGSPKGVQLSHRALLAAMAGLHFQWSVPPHHMLFDHNDTYLSFLSLAHIYEQLLQAFIIYSGGRIGVFSGDIRKILDDAQVLQPTVIALVPRLLNKIYDQV
jgi:long-chain acyl-CoA synthetase